MEDFSPSPGMMLEDLIGDLVYISFLLAWCGNMKHHNVVLFSIFLLFLSFFFQGNVFFFLKKIVSGQTVKLARK